MAIYHWQMKTISRGQGRSATAAAAYRSGQKLQDVRTGQTFDYSRRSGVLMVDIILPDGGRVEREALWNAAELAEKRCNSVVAREIVVALPHELSREQQTSLVKGYAQGLSERTGWAVDVAIHEPGREGDLRNTHAHLLCSTRIIERDPSDCPVVKQKTRDWDIRSSGSILIRSERSEWERCVNQSLEQAHEPSRVDCRSHAEKQTGLEPQVHLGPTVMVMERKGIQTERGDEHRRIASHNGQVIELAQVRERLEKEASWARELQRLESLSLSELEKEAKRYEPCAARTLTFQDPDVQAAYIPLKSYNPYGGFGRGYSWEEPFKERERQREAYEAGRFGWLDERKLEELENAAKVSSTALLWATRYEKQWREAHPYKSVLFDMGIPNRALGELVEKRQNEEAAVSKAEQVLSVFKDARKQAKRTLEAAIQKALPQAEQALRERESRFADIQVILEPKRELAREQERQREAERRKEQGRGGGRSMGR